MCRPKQTLLFADSDEFQCKHENIIVSWYKVIDGNDTNKLCGYWFYPVGIGFVVSLLLTLNIFHILF